MRTKKQIFMLLLALLVGIPTLSAQSKKEKKEQKKEAVKKLIESENYKIDVNTAMPMRGRSIPLTSSYSLEIRNDSVISYLPYYGRAYSIPYGGGDGLNFKAVLKEYSMEMDKKGNADSHLTPLCIDDNRPPSVVSVKIYIGFSGYCSSSASAACGIGRG